MSFSESLKWVSLYELSCAFAKYSMMKDEFFAPVKPLGVLKSASVESCVYTGLSFPKLLVFNIFMVFL